MKKLTSLSSILMLTLFLASCGSSKEKKDVDTDGDGINDFKTDGITEKDKCRTSRNPDFVSSPTNDYDGDGCEDSTEDTDDDNDGINDVDASNNTLDKCQLSEDTTFRSTATNDRDRDGCEDAGEDKDDDNDGINDVDAGNNLLDECPEGIIGIGNDLDNDGCKNSKDTDDDGDRVLDTVDACPRGIIGTNDPDADSDGCKDSVDVDDNGNGLIEIATVEELKNIRYQLDGTSYKTSNTDAGSNAGCSTADPLGCNGYELIGDIDLADLISPAVSNFEPIGPLGSPFTAIFEGNNYTIGNLIISNDARCVGFFGVLGADSEVRNLSFAKSAKSATGTGSVISSNVTTGSVNFGRVGTLVGENKGTISNVSTAIPVSVDVSVTGTKLVGGLVGENSAGTIQNSRATGNVTGGSGDDRVGGLVGQGKVKNSYATNFVNGGSGNDRVGGLVGLSFGINNSYATGSVNGGEGDDEVGGLAGAGAAITNSYSIATVDGGEGADKISHLATSIVQGANTVTSSYYDDDNSKLTGEIVQTFGTGKTSPELKKLTDTNTSWSTNDWKFTADKYPSLKSYKEDASNTQIAGTLLCGQLPVADFVQCPPPTTP